MESVSRRNFLKICGLACVSSILGTTLCGCDDDENPKESEQEIEQKETTEEGVWTKTGNKEVRKAYEHLVYEIVQFKDKSGYAEYASGTYKNGEIIVPDGYAYVGSETMTDKLGYGSTTFGVKYNYVNTVDVEVEEYVNEVTGEVSFPIAGIPLNLEKAEDMPKVLVR